MLVFHQKQNQANMTWNIWMLRYCHGDSLQIQLHCESYDIPCFSFDWISRNSGSHEHPEWPTVLVTYLSVLTNETVQKKFWEHLAHPYVTSYGDSGSREGLKAMIHLTQAEQTFWSSDCVFLLNLGWNQVHSLGAYSKVQLIPLSLGRWEGASFLRSDW